jgi:hypothetical protein
MCLALLQTYARARLDEIELPRLTDGEGRHADQPEHGAAYYEKCHARSYGGQADRDHRPSARHRARV